MKKVLISILFSALMLSCSALTGLATDAALGAVTGSADKGIEVTAQVGKNNNKGLVATSVDTSKDVDIDDVHGNALVDSGNSKTVTNDAWAMIGLVLAGMALPMAMLFYMLPNPKWLARRYRSNE